MCTSETSKVVISTFLLAVFVIGCGDADKNAGTGSPGDPLTLPTITSVTPPDASAGVCPNTAVVSATFSKAMNPATITTTTFTLAGPGSSNVSGQVAYNTSANIATFTPLGSLSPTTIFTATLTTGAKDAYGNALAANKVWTFTTSAVCPPPAAALVLGAACSFGMLGATPSITNIGPTAISGDVGISPGEVIDLPLGIMC